MTPEEMLKLKREAEQLQRDHDKAVGAQEQLTSRLLEEFNCSSLEEAERLLLKLKNKHSKHSKELDLEVREYKEKYD